MQKVQEKMNVVAQDVVDAGEAVVVMVIAVSAEGQSVASVAGVVDEDTADLLDFALVDAIRAVGGLLDAEGA